MRAALATAVAIAVASIGLGAPGASARSNDAVTPRPVTVWATSQADGTVTPIDATTRIAGAPINVGGNTPLQIAATPDGSAVYVTTIGDNAVRRIDTATGEVGPAILLGDDRTANPTSIAITPNGKTAFVSDYAYFGAQANVFAVDLTTDTASAPINTDNEPGAIAITPDGRTAWVTEISFPDSIVPINVKTGTLGAPVVLGGQYPQSISITPDGTTAYVVDFQPGDPYLVPVDLATRTVGTKIPLGVGSTAITPDGTTLYGAGTGLTPVDLATGTVGSIIAPNRFDLVEVAITPDGKAAFATRYENRLGRVVAFDLVHARQRGSATVGAKATGITITPDQAPIAAFSVQRAPAGSATQFDASASQAVSSPIAKYHWDFGDGTSRNEKTATTTHVYAAPGTYTAVLTLTDAAGTSTERVYSSRYMSRNGSRAATRAHAVAIS